MHLSTITYKTYCLSLDICVYKLFKNVMQWFILLGFKKINSSTNKITFHFLFIFCLLNILCNFSFDLVSTQLFSWNGSIYEFVVSFLASFPKFTPIVEIVAIPKVKSKMWVFLERLFDKTNLVWTLDRIVWKGVVNETHLTIIPWGCLLNFVESKQSRL